MTREQLQERLDAYIAAEAACLKGQSYRISDRELRRADLSEIRAAVTALSEELKQMNLKHGRLKRVVFVD